MKVFVLEEEQQKAFLQALYSIIMFDKTISDKETQILEAISKEVFGLDEYLRIDLGSPEKIANAIIQIESETYTQFLFDIARELAESVNRDKRKEYGSFLVQVEDLVAKERARQRGEYIEDSVDKAENGNESLLKKLKTFFIKRC